MKYSKIAIIGGGITGCSLAAALSSHCSDITLFESNDDILNEASLHNEGKIHLGYTYANDRSHETSAFMAQSAMKFVPLMSQWFDFDLKTLFTSQPFLYAVHKQSLLSETDFSAFLTFHTDYLADHFSNTLDYFNIDVTTPPRKVLEKGGSDVFNSETISSIYQTSEIAVDPDEVAHIMRSRLKKLPINILYNHHVTHIQEHGNQNIIFYTDQQNEQYSQAFDLVINASWYNLLKLDNTIGIQTLTSPLFRAKYFIRTDTIDNDLPTTTVIVGQYGDVVRYKNSYMFSWYPAGRIHWHPGINPPKINAIIEGPQKSKISQEILKGLASIFPQLESHALKSYSIRGNWILANGKNDIHIHNSHLHKRNYSFYHRKGNYISVNSVKYTTAPFVVEKVLHEILHEHS